MRAKDASSSDYFFEHASWRRRAKTMETSGEDLVTEAVSLDAYSHSTFHYLVAKNDITNLRRHLSALPRLSPPSAALTPVDALREDRAAAAVSAALDRRDVPRGETPLHLAVRLSRSSAAAALLSAGADPSLQDSAGWTPFQDSLLLRRPRALSLLLLRYHRLSALHKWRRRLPELLSALRRISDFYLELNFRFESSVIPPFILARAAPSDTYRLWKRGAAVRADTSLAGFDGLRITRADRTFLFLGDGATAEQHRRQVDPGTLLVLDHGRKEVCDALEGEDAAMTPEEEEEMVGVEASSRIFRPGVDVTAAELVGRTNWRRKEKVEMVGEWNARVYDIHNIFFSLKTRCAADDRAAAAPSMPDLVLDDDKEDGFLVAELPRLSVSNAAPPRHSCYELSRRPTSRQFRKESSNEGDIEWGFGNAEEEMASAAPPRHSCYEIRERQRPWRGQLGKEGEGGDIVWGFGGAVEEEKARKSVDVGQCKGWEKMGSVGRRSGGGGGLGKVGKEKEMVKSLRPTVWLTEEFPLKTEEVLPLLDVLANKVKAVRRLRELLTTKFPVGTFPVKVAIPVVPTVRVVVTFTKFVELPPIEQFFTPLSSPRQFNEEDEHQKPGHGTKTSWLRWSSSSNNTSSNKISSRSKSVSPSPQSCEGADPFAIPIDYTWVNSASKNPKKSKFKRGVNKGPLFAT